MNDTMITPWQALDPNYEAPDLWATAVDKFRRANPQFASAHLGLDEDAFASFMRWAQEN
jgi:hypothetical protein